MKISLTTLGCKLNQAETDSLQQDLLDRGFSVVGFDSEEDISIIRACGVTCSASQSTRELIRRVKRKGIFVITTGCLENTDMKEIDYIGKNNTDIIKFIEQMVPSDKIDSPSTEQATILNKTRKFIKIQTGCNFQCSYCIIPSFRGKSKSIKASKIIKDINNATETNCKEVVLTGINICLYNDNDVNLAKLLQLILEKTTIKRIRLGSLDPRLITDDLIKIYLDNPNRLMSHWHLSLQSGSNAVLKTMHRGYTTEQYSAIVQKIRKQNPLFSLTTDIIVGFPGETDKEFEKTKQFIEQIQFTKIHIFPFSPRPKTEAAKLKQLHNQTVTNRCSELKKTANTVSADFAKKFIRIKRPVLFESKKDGVWHGYTPEYIRVSCKSSENLTNEIKIIG